MGMMHQVIDVPRTVIQYGIKNFVETGTGIGSTIEFMLSMNYTKDLNIYSIEITSELYTNCSNKFKKFPNVKIYHDRSDEGLKEIFKILSDEPTMFWLDAHFPGADYHINGACYDSETDRTKRIPLEQEIQIISSRNCSRDIIIIDDLRIYKDGPFEHGNLSNRTTIGGNDIDFIYNLCKKTHYIYESYASEGFVILFPRI